MPTGSSTELKLKRNDIIRQALRKIHQIGPMGSLSVDQLEEGATSLNLVLREIDLSGTLTAANLWAISTRYLVLKADVHIYDGFHGLAKDILELREVRFRDTSGDDTPVAILARRQYEDIADKNDKGDPDRVYLSDARELEKQILLVWPVPDSVGTTSQVKGQDGLNYVCVMGHTSSADDEPGVGQNWELYWTQDGSGGSAWATGTDYTNGELLRYVYKRPLYGFDSPRDNPDMPAGWERFLIYRLAFDLAPEYNIDLEERNWLERQWKAGREEIFPSTKTTTSARHNRTLFY